MKDINKGGIDEKNENNSILFFIMKKFIIKIKDILSKLKDILSKLKDILSKLNIKDILIVILILGLLFYFFQYKHYYKKALTPIEKKDTIYEYKDKKGESYIAKDLYQSTIKDLKEEFQKEIKNLKGTPLIVTKVQTKTVIDTIYTKSNEIEKKDSVYNLKWNSNENKWYSLEGTTKVKEDFSNFSTIITNFKTVTNLTYDVIEENKQLKIITKTDNPYIKIENIEGSLLDPTKIKTLKKNFKQKRFGIGPYIGYGFSFKEKEFSPEIGIGLSFHILNF